jgi:tetratricopeptide (TPR) repeat protein
VTETPLNALATALADAAWSMFASGDLWRAVELGERGLHALGVVPRWSPARIDAELVLGRISAVANFQGDGGFGDGGFARTMAIGASAAEQARRLGDSQREAAAYHQRRGALDQALAQAEHSLAIRRRLGLRPYLPLALLAIADIRRAKGERAEAVSLCAEALAEARSMRLPCGEGPLGPSGGGEG